LRTCDEFFVFRTVSRGLRPREAVQLRKSYVINCQRKIVSETSGFFYPFSETVLLIQSPEALQILGLAIQNRQSKI